MSCRHSKSLKTVVLEVFGVFMIANNEGFLPSLSPWAAVIWISSKVQSGDVSCNLSLPC